jgi:hypothetical protein
LPLLIGYYFRVLRTGRRVRLPVQAAEITGPSAPSVTGNVPIFGNGKLRCAAAGQWRPNNDLGKGLITQHENNSDRR